MPSLPGAGPAWSLQMQALRLGDRAKIEQFSSLEEEERYLSPGVSRWPADGADSLAPALPKSLCRYLS